MLRVIVQSPANLPGQPDINRRIYFLYDRTESPFTLSFSNPELQLANLYQNSSSSNLPDLSGVAPNSISHANVFHLEAKIEPGKGRMGLRFFSTTIDLVSRM